MLSNWGAIGRVTSFAQKREGILPAKWQQPGLDWKGRHAHGAGQYPDRGRGKGFVGPGRIPAIWRAFERRVQSLRNGGRGAKPRVLPRRRASAFPSRWKVRWTPTHLNTHTPGGVVLPAVAWPIRRFQGVVVRAHRQAGDFSDIILPLPDPKEEYHGSSG